MTLERSFKDQQRHYAGNFRHQQASPFVNNSTNNENTINEVGYNMERNISHEIKDNGKLKTFAFNIDILLYCFIFKDFYFFLWKTNHILLLFWLFFFSEKFYGTSFLFDCLQYNITKRFQDL